MVGDILKNKLLLGIGLANLATMQTLFMIIFVKAYFHPSKRILVDINVVGEAHIEMVVFTILSIIGYITFIYLLSRLKNDKLN